jgi:hypothetical protein
MLRQKIVGVQSHPDQDKLDDYSSDAPTGIWQGRLDHHAWGKSTNLFCYFTNIEDQKKYRLSVFSRSKYAPYNGDVFFDQEPTGQTFELETSSTKSGNVKLTTAKKI